MDKVPPPYRFTDFSDYARPFARRLVRTLLPTPVQPVHLTLAFVAAGLAAAALLALDRYPILAGALLLLKSGLDAADGALARARRQPSRVGRFADSVGDFVVNLAVYAGLGWAAWQQSGLAGYAGLALAALLSGMLQVSLFNHYYLLYRAQSGGDRTSQVIEMPEAAYAGDNPAVLAALYQAYRLIYGWQDALVAALERATGAATLAVQPGFMTATSVLGLGTQLLVIALCAAAGRPVWALWLFVTLFNAYGLALVGWRAWQARAE